MRLLAIDPGIKTLAWSEFLDGELCAVGLSRTEEKRLDTCVFVHLSNLLHNKEDPWDDVVCERMMHRHGRARDIPPQDLMDVNLVAGGVAGGLGSRVYFVSPAEWKGSVPRKIEQKRTAAALSDTEKALLATVKPSHLAHNAWSAVGIGLAYLGRAHKKNLTSVMLSK